jgi:trehalose utilization protein
MLHRTDPIRVTVWNEHVHEARPGKAAAVYPDGIHAVVAAALVEQLGDDLIVRTATLGDDHQGLPDDVLETTDVLLWWGHLAHDQVEDALAERVRRRVLGGMGLVPLHSAHLSKPFRLLMGTSCNLRWREAEDRELVWVVSPSHPVAAGLPPVFSLPTHEMYGEHFDIPQPDELVFISAFSGGEVFRSGCAFRRGMGRVFYFSPGHETYPVYHDPTIRRVLANAVAWAAPDHPVAVPLDTSPESPTGWFDA